MIDPKSLKEFLKFLEAEKEIELLEEGRNWEWDEEIQEEIQDPPYDTLSEEQLDRLIDEFNKMGMAKEKTYAEYAFDGVSGGMCTLKEFEENLP